MEQELIDIKQLVKVSTYAKSKRNLAKKKVTAQTVYNWIESGILKEVKIDGVRFVYRKLIRLKQAS